MEAINEIIERELERLNTLSQDSALSLNQLKGLEILVKTLKMQLGEDAHAEDLSNLSLSELINISKGKFDAETQEVKHDKRRGSKTSRSDKGKQANLGKK